MADKGFNVQDIFAPRDVHINIPAFFKQKNRLAPTTLQNDRKIASKRVHVEGVHNLPAQTEHSSVSKCSLYVYTIIPPRLSDPCNFITVLLVTREPEQTALLFCSAACSVTPHGLHTADRR